jgi:hypothetical protein
MSTGGGEFKVWQAPSKVVAATARVKVSVFMAASVYRFSHFKSG